LGGSPSALTLSALLRPSQTCNYDIIAIDLPQFGEYKSFLLDLNPLIKESGFDAADFQDWLLLDRCVADKLIRCGLDSAGKINYLSTIE
jgi:hypothetical protein